MTSARLSVGIAAAAGPEVAARIAPALEAAGLHALWVNDTPGHDALAVLAAAAAVTDRLELATGVIPVDRRTPDDILAAAAALPTERLTLGIGAGQRTDGALRRVSDAVEVLRAETAARVVVGALGPRMRRLAITASDGVLLSWLTPDLAARQAAEAREVAPEAHVALYVRAALEEAAIGELTAEAARYASYPAYAANFSRLGVTAGDTILGPTTFDERLALYRSATDEVVLRAITPTGDAAEYARFVDDLALRVAG